MEELAISVLSSKSMTKLIKAVNNPTCCMNSTKHSSKHVRDREVKKGTEGNIKIEKLEKKRKVQTYEQGKARELLAT